MNIFQAVVAVIRSVKQHSTNRRKRWIVRMFLLLFVLLYCLSWTYPSARYYTLEDRKVNQFHYNYNISPKHVCSRNSSPALLVLVLSTAERATRRQSIRETWGSISKTSSWPSRHISTSVKVVYLFGLSGDEDLNKELKDEASDFDDVLQIDLMESYGINVTKKILMGFKWAREHCPGTRHVMKADDDVFVDIPQVLNRLKSVEWSSYMCGHMVLVSFTRRSGRYFLSFKEYPYLFIPSYIFGYFYVMPMEASSRLVDAAQYVPFLRMEDVYITAILTRVTKIPLKGSRTSFMAWDFEFDICDFASGFRDASADLSPETMHSVWRTYKNKSICLPSPAP